MPRESIETGRPMGVGSAIYDHWRLEFPSVRVPDKASGRSDSEGGVVDLQWCGVYAWRVSEEKSVAVREERFEVYEYPP